ncbi:surface antigen-like protein [Leishmania tarentolae]|uniref:Surface antigen-like protein n=1 Tax=Leishmania tarentolae TaxID=5689 RepID=A0A640K7T1_LEITA|nr:surface antigen-like protein [Leishmania tarentolae]
MCATACCPREKRISRCVGVAGVPSRCLVHICRYHVICVSDSLTLSLSRACARARVLPHVRMGASTILHVCVCVCVSAAIGDGEAALRRSHFFGFPVFLLYTYRRRFLCLSLSSSLAVSLLTHGPVAKMKVNRLWICAVLAAVACSAVIASDASELLSSSVPARGSMAPVSVQTTPSSKSTHNSSSITGTTETVSTTSTKTQSLSATASSCAVSNCAVCASTNRNVCTTCNPGYAVDRLGQCMVVGSCHVAHCVTCHTDDNGRCGNCASGYMPTASFKCVPRRSGNAASRTSSLVMSVAVALVFTALAMA